MLDRKFPKDTQFLLQSDYFQCMSAGDIDGSFFEGYGGECPAKLICLYKRLLASITSFFKARNIMRQNPRSMDRKGEEEILEDMEVQCNLPNIQVPSTNIQPGTATFEAND